MGCPGFQSVGAQIELSVCHRSPCAISPTDADHHPPSAAGCFECNRGYRADPPRRG
jgi:hypothetical protein